MGEGIRAGRREWEETESLRGKVTLPWGNAQGLMSLATIKRLLGGQEVERPVGAEGRLRLPRLLARRVRGLASIQFEGGRRVRFGPIDVVLAVVVVILLVLVVRQLMS